MPDNRPNRERAQLEGMRLASKHLSPHFLAVVANSHALLRAYILADAALVRGPLPRRQRRLVTLAIAKIKHSNSCRAVRSALRGSSILPGINPRLAGNAPPGDPTTNALLCITQATLLRYGKTTGRDFLALRKAGFSCAHIDEIVASIALKLFSRHFKRLGQSEAGLLVLKPRSEPRALADVQQEQGACRRD